MLGLSLFSGIGGLDVAFECAGGRVVAMCEQDAFCQKILRKHWPVVQIINDVKDIRGGDFNDIDIIFGGFPCQPFSVAGKRQGKKDERFLWPEFSRLVGEIKPRWVVAENVPGILSIAADGICQDLESKGYSVGIFNYEALAVGAPHKRSRVFFVAHSNSERELQQEGCIKDIRGWAGNGSEEKGTSANANSQRCEEQRGTIPAEQKLSGTECCSGRELESGVGRGLDGLSPWMDGDWEDGIPRTARGIPNRVARLKALGNAVVPHQAYVLFKAIIETEKE